MKQPEGFVEPGFEDHVCKLIHTIYGTMQGTHDWYKTLTETYNKLGYVTSRADPCVRYKREDNGYTLTDTYMDDVRGPPGPSFLVVCSSSYSYFSYICISPYDIHTPPYRCSRPGFHM